MDHFNVPEHTFKEIQILPEVEKTFLTSERPRFLAIQVEHYLLFLILH